jgi:hypothetical protein
MSLNLDYLQELSELFIRDVKGSAYYADLSEKQRLEFDAKAREEKEQGLYPLVPGATEEELTRLSEAFRQELGILLPSSVTQILRVVDGFVESGVALYGVDGEFRDDRFESGPGILAENHVKWSAYEETIQRYLFVGDSDLWFFAVEISTSQALVLDRSTLVPKHRFATVEEMVNDMMHLALGYLRDVEEGSEEDVPGDPPENLFSRN